jgi:hypothetical protein
LLEDEFTLLETDIEFVRWFVEETDFWKTIEEEARFVCGAWKTEQADFDAFLMNQVRRRVP